MTASKKNIWILLLAALLVMAICCVIYNVYDNQRFVVVKQTIEIEGLPEAFEGFTILQFTDLHGKYFGPKQKKLLTTVNTLDFDMVAFTGDMNLYMDSSEQGSQAVLDLIRGIEKKDNMFWVDGNAGPFAIKSIDGINTGTLTTIGAIIEEKGCQILNSPVAINRGTQRIWIVPEMSKEQYETLNQNGEIKILLVHYPLQTDLTQEQWEGRGDLDYSLIIAGHYHGGQIRIPFFGALYIPSATSGLGGFFPPQSDVKGLNNVNGIPQYVSAGLGASSSIKIMRFRFFNTPEINLITLTRANPAPSF